MSLLKSLTAPANVAVIGASGGMGSAFVELLSLDANVGRVYALSRTPIRSVGEPIEPHAIDITDESSIEKAVSGITTGVELDLVIVASGVLHDAKIQPEKSMRSLSAGNMSHAFAINTIGPALVAMHCLPHLRRSGKSVFAVLSARVGSIGDNRKGGWLSYRASKAALNMVIRTLSIEQRWRRPDSVVVALHPGTVDTDLSKPFSENTTESALFTAEQSARYLLRVIDGLTPADSGGFLAWDGSQIEY